MNNMFIRTKDGRIYDLQSKEVSSWEYIDNDTAINEYGVECAFYTIYYFDENKGHYSEYDGKGGHSCDFIEEKDIIKQSDNLAELCDVVVIKRTNKDTNIAWYVDYPMEYYQDVMIDSRLDYIKIDYVRFGIWTDKGLIYVAKLNDDRKLELL